MQLNWLYKPFHELTAIELYAIMQLRNEVFIIEQHCIYQDADGKDNASWHLSGWDNDKLVTYCRILPPGVAYAEPSIGRVVTSPLYRKTGCGKILMKIAIQKILTQFQGNQVKIGAQLYLKQFYESMGFIQTSDQYLEDGIPHIEMILKQ